jgi:3-deoxy-manno-octulosonate cytidylyltransferase (CMP-KDO synthetase)
MNIIAIIPARMAASRFPGKPLHKLCGIPMVGHCYFRANLAHKLDSVFIATCDQDIVSYGASIGAEVIMTDNNHTRATDRVAEALLKIEASHNKSYDIILMIQGDEPLITPDAIDTMLEEFEDPAVEIVNIVCPIKTRQQFEDKNNVKVVINNFDNAMYFSREAIPSPWKGINNSQMLMQVGVIAFRRRSLLDFNAMPQTQCEKIESIDMNRVLENGGSIRTIKIDFMSIGVDTPEEAIEVAEIMENDQFLSRYIKK